ncbi:microfibrillar-associated protein 2 isoform X2 [Tamandua tetradactyla]|uniref:microfibrillar-associated protein 2 isoform X2 n=2 Tax=Tamandua tetradactyla TaxID=48850 RepID=UPI004053BFDD
MMAPTSRRGLRTDVRRGASARPRGRRRAALSPLTPSSLLHSVVMRPACLFLLFLPGVLAQGQFDLDPLSPFPDHVQYTHYSDPIDNPDYYDYQEVTPQLSEEQFQFQSQQQGQQEVFPVPTPEPGNAETEPTEPGPFDCREEQYPCTRLYSIHKPCKQCLNEVCFYSLRRMYVINKEICVRTVCAHEELLRADLCRDKFSRCGVMASSGLCQSVASSCARSCGGC